MNSTNLKYIIILCLLYNSYSFTASEESAFNPFHGDPEEAQMLRALIDSADEEIKRELAKDPELEIQQKLTAYVDSRLKQGHTDIPALTASFEDALLKESTSEHFTVEEIADLQLGINQKSEESAQQARHAQLALYKDYFTMLLEQQERHKRLAHLKQVFSDLKTKQDFWRAHAQEVASAPSFMHSQPPVFAAQASGETIRPLHVTFGGDKIAGSKNLRKRADKQTPNQDFFTLQHLANGDTLLAVFDGHGDNGHDIAQYASERLPVILSHYQGSFDAACQQLQTEIAQNPKAQQSGSTLVATLIKPSGQVTVANLGDSSALLIRDGKVIAATTDHDSKNPSEKIRVESAGGSFDAAGQTYPNRAGSGPVSVGVTRALGDIICHGERNNIVISQPETFTWQTQPGDYLVLSSDGRSDFLNATFDEETFEAIHFNQVVISNDEVALIIEQNKKLSPQELAKLIKTIAYEKKNAQGEFLTGDDIAVVVAKIE